MRVLFTGASSGLGARLLKLLIEDPNYSEIWCGINRHDVSWTHPKLRRIPLDLASEFSLAPIPQPVDLVIHCAAVTHTNDEAEYWRVNHKGTRQLAEKAQALGCQRFFYMSSRCAALGNGAYGESKLAAETELKNLSWKSLAILQPAEIFGIGGREGLDKWIRMAARLHVAPLLWGSRHIGFAPIHCDDFIRCVLRLLRSEIRGVQTFSLCGPENLNGGGVALRLARKYLALPLPIWWPALEITLTVLASFGLRPVARDQVLRLIGHKTATLSSPACTMPNMIRFPEKAML